MRLAESFPLHCREMIPYSLVMKCRGNVSLWGLVPRNEAVVQFWRYIQVPVSVQSTGLCMGI